MGSKFKMYDQATYITDAKIFSYTVGDSELYQADQELGFIQLSQAIIQVNIVLKQMFQITLNFIMSNILKI